MLLDERLERRRGTAAELLHEVVGALEDPVLVVDHDLLDVLDEEGIAGTWLPIQFPIQVPGGCP